MNRKLLNHRYMGIMIFSIIFLLPLSSNAEYVVNQVIVSGQVVNYEYGNPVDKHPVYIESELSPEGRSKGYTNIVYTDSHGYYYDTINTIDTKGSFFVYTYDHFGESIDTTIHFRFHERENSMIIADFSIYLPFHSEILQARFKYIQKLNGDRNSYSFFDLTNHPNAISWEWNFGDGATSSLQNPKHEYMGYGLFRVSLSVTAIIEGVPVESVISKQIYITQIEYYHFGGHVFSDHFPIDKGYAYLYMVDSSSRYLPFDTVAFDTLGYYYFYQVPESNYIVKAEPMKESDYYGVLLPTYFGNTLLWESAELIELENTSWEYDIKLEKGSGINGGTGAISGNVRYINSGRNINEYSAKGVNIYIIDEEDNILSCHYSDDDGNFGFDLIDIDTYWLFPEVTGITSEKIHVELTQQTPVVDDIEINILSSSISYVMPSDDDPNSELIGLPYPNPVSEYFSLPMKSSLGKDISYQIYDSYGHLVSSENVTSGSKNGIVVNASDLNSGVYFIRTTIDNQSYNRRFVVSK